MNARVTDTTPKPCHHTTVTHQHGTSVCYLRDSCRCDQCSRAHQRTVAVYRLRKEEGTPVTIPVSVVTSHIRTLQAAGMSVVDIASEAGCARSLVTRYLYPTTKRCRVTTARRFLNIPVPTSVPDAAGYVPYHGTQRRIQALACLGYDHKFIARKTGICREDISEISRGKWANVRASTAHAIKNVYEQYEARWATNNDSYSPIRTRNRARNNGWVPPLGWDDDANLDDPNTKPLPRGAWDPSMRPGTSTNYWLRHNSLPEAE